MNTIHDCRLLIIDDEPTLLKMLIDLLKQNGFYNIISASNCKEARTQFLAMNPDAILLDVSLPDGDGFSLMREFRSHSVVPVLFLSARDEDEDRLLGLGLGADDYITKPFLPRELILRLHAVLNRTYFPLILNQDEKPVFTLGALTINFNNATISSDKGIDTLTAKEFALLWKLYENKEKIVSGDSLCQAAWKDTLYGYENTLMVHIRRLREKIEPEPSNPRFLLTIRGIGYKLTGGKSVEKSH